MIVEKKAKDKKFDDGGKKAEEAWEARTMAPPCHLVLPGAPKSCTIFTICAFTQCTMTFGVFQCTKMLHNMFMFSFT